MHDVTNGVTPEASNTGEPELANIAILRIRKTNVAIDMLGARSYHRPLREFSNVFVSIDDFGRFDREHWISEGLACRASTKSAGHRNLVLGLFKRSGSGHRPFCPWQFCCI